jgi:DNA-binding response OmpR family regulator
MTQPSSLSTAGGLPRKRRPPHIAVVDDDPIQVEFVKRAIGELDLPCSGFSSPQLLLPSVLRDKLDLVVLDWQMPGMTGPELVQWIREHAARPIPLIMSTVRCDESDLEHALVCGADDFVSKPLRARELKARVRALLRRAYPDEDRHLIVRGRFLLDLRQRSTSVDGRAIELTHKEFELAWRLFMHEGELLPRRTLLHAIWGPAIDPASRCLDTCIWTLRHKLHLRPAYGVRLSAVYGTGYRLEFLEEAGDAACMPSEELLPVSAAV